MLYSPPVLILRKAGTTAKLLFRLRMATIDINIPKNCKSMRMAISLDESTGEISSGRQVPVIAIVQSIGFIETLVGTMRMRKNSVIQQTCIIISKLEKRCVVS